MRPRLALGRPAHTTPRTTPRPIKFASDWWRIAVLAVALPMFAQTFQYLIDVYPLYTLSKIWPVLTLPLFCWGMVRLDFPHKGLIMAALAWVLGVAPVLSVIQLGNDLGDALATTVKAWCFTFPIAGAAALVLLRTSPVLLRKMVIWLGVALFLGLLAVWVVVPFSTYESATESKLFMYDDERGYHLFMPTFFGLVLMFALNRSFWIRPKWWKPVLLVLCFVLLLTIYKERATIAGAAVTVVLGAVLSLRPRLRPAGFAALAVLGSLGMLLVLQHLQSPSLNQSLGGSLSIRKNSVASAMDFLGADPLRWIFGAGATTRLGSVNIQTILHNNAFFLADIGWLGILFEYGLIGSALILMVHLAGLKLALQTAHPRDAVALAIADYILFILVVSPIYSAMFTPGEMMTCFALSWYLSRAGGQPVRGVSPR